MIDYSEARKRSITAYMESIGHVKKKCSRKYSFFSSPFTDDRDPSFCIDESRNRFMDYSSGKKGSILDLVMELEGCDLKGAVSRVTGIHESKAPKTNGLIVLKDEPLTSPALCDYILQRRIPLGIANKYVREVTYAVDEYEFTAIGFKNISGGWELRKEGWKGGSSPKNISVIHGDTKYFNVFEGFFDFLSFLALRGGELDYHSVVLNSVVFKDRVANEDMRLYVDNDRAGDEVVEYYSNLYNVRDMRFLFKGYNDLNEFLNK